MAVFLLVPASPESAAAAAPAATRIIQPAGDAGKPVPDPWIAAPAPDDTSTLEQQREDVADAVSTLPMVDRAVWYTQSTLQVFLLAGRGNAFEDRQRVVEGKSVAVRVDLGGRSLLKTKTTLTASQHSSTHTYDRYHTPQV